MKSLKKSQQGATFIVWFIMIVIVVGFLTVALKLIPAYLADYRVSEVLHSVAKDAAQSHQAFSTTSIADIKTSIDKRLMINEIRFLSPRDITLTYSGSDIIVQIKYDHQVHIFGNIDALLYFDHSVKIKR